MEQQELTNKVLTTLKHFADTFGNDYGVTDVWAEGFNVVAQRRELQMTLDIVYDVWDDDYVVRDVCNIQGNCDISFLSNTAVDFYKLRDLAHEVEKNERRVAKNMRILAKLQNFAQTIGTCDIADDGRMQFQTLCLGYGVPLEIILVEFWINFQNSKPTVEFLLKFDPETPRSDELAQEVSYLYDRLSAELHKLTK